MRLEHDWLPRDLPSNVLLAPNVFLHSAYAFNHYRSRRPVGLRVGEHTAMYDGTMFDLGPSGEVEIGRYGIVYGTHFVADSRVVVGDYAYLSYEVFITDADHPIPPVDPDYDATAQLSSTMVLLHKGV